MIEQLYQIYLKHPYIQTDSRKIKQGEIFFALTGENFDGNKFVDEALKKGAAYIVSSDKNRTSNDRVMIVDNVLDTLQQLAKHHRQQFKIPFLGITGSNGKTTTKELIAAVLNTTYKISYTLGNLNNHIGIPLTLLSIPLDAEIAIIEMGANHLYEIKSYCQYAMPSMGIITNCGKAHIGEFGGEENIKKAKGELFDYLTTRDNNTVFICEDFDYLIKMSAFNKNIFTYSTINKNANVYGNVIASPNHYLNVEIKTLQNTFHVNTYLVGDYNIYNILAACCIGSYFKIDYKKIKMAIENYQPNNSRSQLVKKDTNQIILDAYNANPSSMKLAIDNFTNMPHNKKIIMLGGMKELGEYEQIEHQQLIQQLQQHNFYQVVLVGKEFFQVHHSYLYFENSALAKEWFIQQNITDALILIKGSRSSSMEKIIDISSHH